MQIKTCVAILMSLAFAFHSAAASAQQSERPDLHVITITDGTPPAIDGKVDDEVWNTAIPYSTFTQQEPDEGQAATERTELRFLADRQNLYISVIAFDREPDRIIVTQSRRDG